MKTSTILSGAAVLFLVNSCMVAVNNDDRHDDLIGPDPYHQVFSRTTWTCFPFEDNANQWHYSEAGGNTTSIFVTDTISDNGVLYYRVSFRENRVDTTDDWFQRTRSGIYFGASLIGGYNLFLPAKIDSVRGSFRSAGTTVNYAYHDSLLISGIMFHQVLDARYSMPLLHGFDEITFVDSIGIVRLVDHTGRWPITYMIDSCSVSGVMKRF